MRQESLLELIGKLEHRLWEDKGGEIPPRPAKTCARDNLMRPVTTNHLCGIGPPAPSVALPVLHTGSN